MLKKTITYTDFNGVERTEDFYFNLSRAELTEMELVKKGGMAAYLKTVIQSDDNRQIMDVFNTLLKASYGVRSEDGRSFIKTEEAWQIFKGSSAFDVLFMSFFENGTVAADFMNGIVPAELAEQAGSISTQDGFRPGSETLPKSRREALAEEATQGTQSSSGDLLPPSESQ